MGGGSCLPGVRATGTTSEEGNARMSTAPVAADHREAAGGLLAGLDGGSMDPTAYDTAWVARLVQRGNPRLPLFPEAVGWLLRAQRDDGSWGAEVETLHDRIAATLAALTALAGLLRRGAAMDLPRQDVARRIDDGRLYLRRRAPGLAADPHETVGFELAVPVLLQEARDLGLELPWGECACVAERRAAKLARLPAGWQAQVGGAMVHTLEGWGAEAGAWLPSLRGPDGSCANSPSATAFYYGQLPDETARRYLQDCVRRGRGGVADVYPFEVFELAWVLDHLALGGLLPPRSVLAGPINRLRAAWGDGTRGTGISRSGLEPDADDTALTAVVLARAGLPVSAQALAAFRREGGFACFPFERNPSVSANIHVAYALRHLPFAEREAALGLIHDFLRAQRRPDGAWTDKWHVSPWYPTCRAVIAVGELWPELVAPAVDWLLDGQRADGSWGLFGGSAEETAYAVEALAGVGGARGPAARAALARAGDYLEEADASRRPALWVGKGLYHPRAVVDAAVLAARHICAGGERA